MSSCRVYRNARAYVEKKYVDTVITEDDKIVFVGSENNIPQAYAKAEIHDVQGRLVTPGFIDCHTHLVFGGNRATECAMRWAGASYAEIAKQGGGIVSTVRQTRTQSEEALLQSAGKRLQALCVEGVTSIEIKSGYGLSLESELKMLRVASKLAEQYPVEVFPTLLAAHALPPEFNDKQQYIDHVCQEILPAAVDLIHAVDLFCEHIAFDAKMSEQVCQAARALNIPLKMHVGQLSDCGGAALAARYQALSADHLEYVSETDIIALAQAGVVAVLLPGAYYYLRETQKPPVELMRKHHLKMALATDCNPGTSPVLSLRTVMNLACVLYGFTPQEALDAVTLHAARALNIADTHGSITVGKFADLLIWDLETIEELPYWLGGQFLHRRIWRGVY
jgi:imidazolonepropionase